MKYGSDGYAIYWYCLELIATKIDKENYTFELEHDAELIGHRLKIDQIRVEEIMKYMVSINLFQIHPETRKIMCLQLAKRVDDSTLKNEEIRSAIAKFKDDGLLEAVNKYVYVLKSGEKYKIGRTNNIDKRIREAKTFDPNIELIHTIETSDNVLLEKKIHEYFKDKKVDGEWFRLVGNDISHLLAIKGVDDVFREIPKNSEKLRTEEIRKEEIRKEENTCAEARGENELFHTIEKSFLSQLQDDTQYNYPKERKHIKGLLKRIRNKDSPTEFIRQAMETFHRLKSGRDKFWQKQPFLPSVLNSDAMWPRVVEEMGSGYEDTGVELWN